MTTDAQLVAQVRAGGTDAVETLYRRHISLAINYARRLTHDHALGEDLAAEAFLRMWEGIRAGRTPLRPGSYLCQSIHNLFVDQVRHESITRLPDPDVCDVTADIAVDVVERDALVQAVGELRANQRVVLWETAVEGLTTSEAGALHGSPTANAGAQFAYRARHALREAYLEVSA